MKSRNRPNANLTSELCLACTAVFIGGGMTFFLLDYGALGLASVVYGIGIGILGSAPKPKKRKKKRTHHWAKLLEKFS